ncbi:SRPBCC domain-containing protein [Pseudonocardia nematodicida]|uniref:SRPBCC domain-containing protein n=1 Tax=Pseudonocardia nematodicida TaxID=1206997 RepID=A0ABV1KBG2_9PSEU
MRLASSFPVPAAADKVVALFLDPETMRSCIPGCEELTRTDDSHYAGRLVNEVAHVRFTARFTAEITSVTHGQDGDPAVVVAVLRGEDRRLGSTIRMDATLTVTPRTTPQDGDAAEVGYEFELAVRGKLGRLGEAVIRRRTAEVERQFAEALTAVCAGRPVPRRGEDAGGHDDGPGSGAGEPPAAGPAAAAGSSAVGSVAVAGAATPSASGVHSGTGDPVPGSSPAVPAGRDRLVLGLAVAAAFAYGILVGERWGGRR